MHDYAQAIDYFTQALERNPEAQESRLWLAAAYAHMGRSEDARVLVEPGKVIGSVRSDLSEWLAERGGEIVEVGAIPPLKAERVK